MTLFDKIDIEKTLKIAAIAIFLVSIILEIISVRSHMTRATYPDPEQIFHVILLSLSMLVSKLYQPLVLIGIAELIRLKKGNKK